MGELTVLQFRLPSGESPFETWLDALQDRRTVARIYTRINRIKLGNFGDCKPLHGGICELRLDFGPGYRIYFGRKGPSIVILLAGGDKHRQAADIRRAIGYWNECLKNRGSS